MTSVQNSNLFLRLTLLAPCPCVRLASTLLARHLGIPVEAAVERLGSAPSTLAERMEAPAAQRLAALMGALGMRVRTDPQDLPLRAEVKPFVDLAVQPLTGEDLEELAAAVLAVLPPGLASRQPTTLARLLADLAGPGGLLLRGLSTAQADQARRALRRLAGLRVMTSDPMAAVYDVLLDPRTRGMPSTALMLYLRRLGVGACPLTGAIAAGLDARTLDHLMRRFPAEGLVAMNRDFQRFDLFLTGTHNLSPRELADFLIARSDLPRRVLEQMPHPLRIETGLTRVDALAFQADYAALGLETEARLRVYHPVRSPWPDQVLPQV